MYQFTKFARRNRALVGGVACAIVLLIAGVIGTGLGLVRAKTAERQAQADATTARLEAHRANQATQSAQLETQRANEATIKARLEARKAIEATAFLQGMLNAANPESGKRGDLTVRELLMQASNDLDSTLDAEPEVAAAVHFTIGSAFVGMQDFEPATQHLQKALELRQQTYDDKGWRVANCYHRLGILAFDRGNRESGLADVRRGLDLIKADPEAMWEDVAIHELDLSQMLNSVGKFSEAEQAATRAVDIATTTGGKRHGITAAAIAALANVSMSQGQYARAEAPLREAIEMTRTAYGPKSPRVAGHLIDLGKSLSFLTRDAEAEPLLAEAVEIRRFAFGPDHPKVAVPLEQLANAQMVLKKLTASESSAREALRIRQTLDAESPDTVNAIQVLCKVLQRQNRIDDAEPLARQALDIRLRILGEDNKLTAQSMETFGELLVKQKKFDQAREVLLRAVAIRKKVQGERHVLVSNGLRTLGLLSVAIEDAQSAIDYYGQAASLLDEAFEDDHAVLVGVRLALASNQTKAKRYDDAEASYRLALAGLRKRRGNTDLEVANCLTALAGVLRAKGDSTGADEALSQAAQAKVNPGTTPPVAPDSGG